MLDKRKILNEFRRLSGLPILNESENNLTIEEFFRKYGIDEDDLSYLGSGDFGKAYSIGDSKVLKITNSKSEFRFAKEIAGKNIPALDGFADIYVAEIVDNQYYIIMEELDEDSDIEDLYYQVEELLSNEGLPIQYLHMLDTDELELDDDLLKFISDMEDINHSYRYLGIEASDIKPDNLGVDKNGKVKAFDIDDRSVNEQYKTTLKEEYDSSITRYYHGSPFNKLNWGDAPDEAGWATEGYGIYITPDIDQAKGYAIKEERDGYLYTLEMPSGMNIIDFNGSIPDYAKKVIKKIPNFYKFFEVNLLDTFDFDSNHIGEKNISYTWDRFGDELPQWAIEDGYEPNTWFIWDEKTNKEVAKNLKGKEEVFNWFKTINMIDYKEYIYLSDVAPKVSDYFNTRSRDYSSSGEELYLEDLEANFDALYFYVAAHFNSLKKATIFFTRLGIDGVYTTKWSDNSHDFFLCIYNANKLNVINKQKIKYDNKGHRIYVG